MGLCLFPPFLLVNYQLDLRNNIPLLFGIKIVKMGKNVRKGGNSVDDLVFIEELNLLIKISLQIKW